MIVSLAHSIATTRASTERLRVDLERAQKELASGRRSDIGLADGPRSIAVVSMRADIFEGQAFLDANRIASSRLSALGTTLGALKDIAQGLQQQILGGGFGATGAKAISQAGLAALSQAVAAANTTFDGLYLLSGLNDGSKPLSEFAQESASAPARALDQAFQSRFGSLPGDQGNSSIAPSDMQTFLDSDFAEMFEPRGWNDNWSNASDLGSELRISDTASLRYPAVGNSAAVRAVIESLTMVAGLGLDTLSSDTRQIVLDRAAMKLGNAIAEITTTAAAVGVSQSTIEDASKLLTLRHDQASARLDEFETADPAEIGLRISALSEKLQASYQVTVKLAHLSLINYL